MKRIIALALAVLMMAALFCACGEEKKSDDAGTDSNQIKAVIDSKYDDGFAEQYAKSVTTDDSGNKVYEFDAEGYKEYTRNYNNKISASITNEVSKNHSEDYGQYCYINEEKQAVIVGVNPGKYDEAAAKEEAPALAKQAFSYFKGIETPTDTVKVLYCNANNQDEVYGQFEFPIE